MKRLAFCIFLLFFGIAEAAQRAIPVTRANWYPAGVSLAFDFANARYYDGSNDILGNDNLGYIITGNSRTNLMQYGGILNDASWNISNGLSAVSTGIADPNGGNTAYKIQENSALGIHLIFAQSLTFSAGGAVSGVFVVKASERTLSHLLIQDAGANNFYGLADLTTGSISGGSVGTATYSTSSSINLGNGWWQFTLTGKLDPSATVAFVGIYLADASNNTNYQGVTGSGIYAWRINIAQAPTANFSIFSQGLATTKQSASGPSWELFGNFPPKIIKGRLSNEATTGQQASYFTANLNNNKNISRIGGAWTFTAGSGGLNGAATFVIWQTDILNLISPNSGCHLAIGTNNWILGYIENNQPVVTMASGVFTPPASGVYQSDVRISGNTATIYLPDGTSTQVTNSKIGSLAGPYATWEIFQSNATTDAKPEFITSWAN